MKDRKKLKKVYVEWEDVVAESGWYKMDKAIEWCEDKQQSLITDIGFIVIENEDYIALTQSYYECDQEYDGIKKIPRKYIKKIRIL